MRNLIKKSCFYILILVAFSSYSQTKKIEGVVKDTKTNISIPYATVVLKNLDGSFIIGTSTNDEGFYSLEYKKGNYTLELSFMGYETKKIPIALNRNLEQNIQLSINEVTIDEVIIIAETTTVRQLIDKKVIQVGKDILSSGGSAATVLSQLSEVDADESGNISLRGNSNVQVLVNGKPSPLSSSELLAQIPASEIVTIEVITSPSAKYKADGLTGIINIITKKKVKKGFTSSNSLSYNSLGGYSGNSSVSFGTNKVNYKLGVFYRNNISESTWKRERFGIHPYTEASNNDFQGEVSRFNAGIDWFINKRNEFSWGINYSDNKHHTDIDKSIFSNSSLVLQKNYTGHVHQQLQLNSNYRHTFINEKDFIELDVDYTKYNNTLKGYFNPNITIFDNMVINEIGITNIALDNSIILNDNTKLETGYLFHQLTLDNERAFYDNLNTITSKDIYTIKQPTHALYTQVKYDTDKLGVQIGLRGEQYKRTVNFVSNNIVTKNTFSDLFPSIHFKYTPNEVHTFGIGYNRRTYRPRLYQINPFSSQSDEFTYRKGNPNLKPEFSNNLDVTHQFKKGKTTVSTTLSYQKINNNIVQNQTVDSNGVQLLSFINGNNSDYYGLEIGINYKPIKWLKSHFNFNWNYYTTKADFPNDFERSYQFTFKNNIKLAKKITSNISWRYRGASIDYFGERDQSQTVDVGFKFKIIKNKANVNLRFTNVFNSSLYKGVAFGNLFSRNYEFKRESRAVHVAFSYNFSKGKLEKRKKKKRAKDVTI